MGISWQSGSSQYSGKKYQFQADLFVDPEYNIAVGLAGSASAASLSPENIVSCEYENALNSLVFTGKIVYNDSTGKIANFIGRQHIICNICFFEYKQHDDPPSGNENANICFQHSFLVTNIETLERTADFVSYSIHMVGVEWLNCSHTVNYSNYDTEESAVFDIMQECFVEAGLKSNLSGGPAVNIHYATSGQDTCFSVMRYLMHKSYYLQKRDASPKFIRYDELSNQYVVFDMNSPIYDDFSAAPIFVSFQRDTFEQSMYEEQNEIASVSRRSGVAAIEDQFDHTIYSYNILSNALYSETIKSENISEYYNSRSISVQPRYVPYKPLPSRSYERVDSYWNSRWEPYNDFINDLFESDAVVVNTVGQIQRKPGSVIVILFSKDVQHDNENYSIKEEYEQRYQGLEGEWIIGRVRNIIYPAEGRYRQNLLLIRNFCNKVVNNAPEQPASK